MDIKKNNMSQEHDLTGVTEKEKKEEVEITEQELDDYGFTLDPKSGYYRFKNYDNLFKSFKEFIKKEDGFRVFHKGWTFYVKAWGSGTFTVSCIKGDRTQGGSGARTFSRADIWSLADVIRMDIINVRKILQNQKFDGTEKYEMFGVENDESTGQRMATILYYVKVPRFSKPASVIQQAQQKQTEEEDEGAKYEKEYNKMMKGTGWSDSAADVSF